MTDEELQHLLELRSAYVERIHVLEERQARRGELPTAEAIDLIQARRDLEGVEARLQTVPLSRDARQAIGRDAHTIILEYRVKVVEDKLHDGLLTLNNAIGDVRRLLTKALIVFAALFVVIVLALLIVERWR